MPKVRGAISRRSPQGLAQEPTWIGPPAPDFSQGTAGTRSVLPQISGFKAAKHALTLSAGSLGNGVTLNPADGYVYDGAGAAGTLSNLQLTIANKADLDWIARSTAPGVTQACDFSGPNDFLLSTTNGGHIGSSDMSPSSLARIVKDTSDGCSNGCCLRIDSPKEVGANSAEWMTSLNSSWTANNQSFGLNTEFFIQFRFKIPSSRLFKSDVGDSGTRGWKFANIAQYSPTNTGSQSFSNTLAEHVLQDSYQRGFPQAYHRDTFGSFPGFEGFAGGQITLQHQDRGAGFTVPGDRYCHYPNGTNGCEYFQTDEWMTFKLRLKIASYAGGAGNEFDFWMLRKDATVPVQIFSARDYNLGSPDSNGGGFTGINGIHFLTYETYRVPNSPLNIFDTWQKWDQLIVSTQDIAWPAVGC